MNTPWNIELFGQLCARQGKRVITRFRTQKTGILLAYLALFPDRPHPREELIERFWPEEEPQAGRNSLRVALSSLRRQLEPPGMPPNRVLIADRSTVQLNPAAVHTDVIEFDALLSSASRQDSGAQRSSLLQKAVDLYRGPLLPGYYEEWILEARERWAAKYIGALRLLIRSLAQQRDYEAALDYARRAVSADPLREEFHRNLIRLYVAIGRPAEALTQYHELERLLQEELNTSPSPTTQELARQIPGYGRSKAAGQLAQASPALPPPTPTPTEARFTTSSPEVAPAAYGSAPRLPMQLTRFFGRETELARLGRMLQLPEREKGRRGEGETKTSIEDQHLPLSTGQDESGGSDSTASDSPSPLLPFSPSRLITLTGTGGTGKTRLAIEVADRLRPAYEDRVWFVPLAEVADTRLIAGTILDALNLPPSHTIGPLDQIASTLSGSPALLVLDNFEQIASGGAAVVLALLKRLPLLRCLVTSRRRLHLPGEREFAVSPLPVPEKAEGEKGRKGEGEKKLSTKAQSLPLSTGQEQSGGSRSSFYASPSPPLPFSLSPLLSYPSVQLFVDRAQVARSDFQVTARNASDVAALCRQLEGLPLALELAAARAQVLSPAQMLARLSERFELLATRRTDKSSRQRSLWATLDWSYHLLPSNLQRFFARLAVFRGSWSIEAAEAVCSEPAALEYSAQLQTHSLIAVEEAEGEMRFRMLEALREFAAEQLTEEARADLAYRHASYFLSLAEAAEEELKGPNQGMWLARLHTEQDNLRAALEWCLKAGERGKGKGERNEDEIDQGKGKMEKEKGTASQAQPLSPFPFPLSPSELGLRLAGALWRYWEMHGDLTEGRAHLEAMLAKGDPNSRARVKALIGAAFLAQGQGERQHATELIEQGLALSRKYNDRAALSDALHVYGITTFYQGNYAQSIELTEQGLALRRQMGDRWRIAQSLNSLGLLARRAQGDDARALQFYQEALQLTREVGDRQRSSHILYNIANLAKESGDYSQAVTLIQECLAIYKTMDDPWGRAYFLNLLGSVLKLQGHTGQAIQTYQDCLRLSLDLGDRQTALYVFWNLIELFQQWGDLASMALLMSVAEKLRQDIGSPVTLDDQATSDARISAARAALGEPGFASAWEQGRTMTFEQSIRWSLENLKSSDQ